MPLVASLLEHEILPARVADYTPAQLDTLLGAGEVSWVGVEPLGDRDGRIALYLTDHLRAAAAAARREAPELDRAASAEVLDAAARARGASFFAPLHAALGGGFPQETVDALWSLVWKGLVTNDTLHALRAYLRPPERSRRPRRARTPFRSRRLVPPSAEGRWTAIAATAASRSLTEWATAFSQQLLTRHGVVTREVTAIEQIPGGFSTIYPVLRRLEETGRVRRGYFVAGLGAAQFAQPGAVDLLRAAREEPETPHGRHARGDRSGQSVRRAAAVARVDRRRRHARLRRARERRRCAACQPLGRRARDPRRRPARRLDRARRSRAAGLAAGRRTRSIARGPRARARAGRARASRARRQPRLADRRDQRRAAAADPRRRSCSKPALRRPRWACSFASPPAVGCPRTSHGSTETRSNGDSVTEQRQPRGLRPR